MAVVGVLHHNADQMVEEVSGGIGRKGGEGEEDYSQPVEGLILQNGESGVGDCNANACQIQYHNGPTRKTILHVVTVQEDTDTDTTYNTVLHYIITHYPFRM